jgi:hypothetical protein
MAEMTIKLRVNPGTGRPEVLVDLESDADALPYEHEELHRRVVQRLLEAGLLPDGDAPNVVIRRGAVEEPAVAKPSSSGTERRATSNPS